MNREWLDLAACRDSAAEFVDIAEAEADELITTFCQRCPTQVPCAALGAEQRHDVGSVWGGRYFHKPRPR